MEFTHLNNNENNNYILVIGASGAIGKYLLSKLINNYGKFSVVAALHRSPLPQYLSDNVICEFGFDIRNENTIKILFEKYKGKITSIWNLAAPLSVDTANDPNSAYDITVGGMERLLRCMKEYNIQTIYFSDSIGSFGISSPRENCPTNWLSENPEQDPGSDYGIQKRLCRNLLHEYSLNYNFDTRFIIIPGVLHCEPSWAGGTTEYALDAIQAAIDNKHYHCPVPLDTKLPMIHVDDLVCGMVALMNASSDIFQSRNNCRGLCLAGFSFTPNELFSLILKYYPNFTSSYDPDISPNATKFAITWPDSLDPQEAYNLINFRATKTFEDTINDIIQAHQNRIQSNNMS